MTPKGNEMITRYLTERAVAKITGYSVQTLRNWRFQKKGFPYLKIGRAVRYKAEDICAYMETQRLEAVH